MAIGPTVRGLLGPLEIPALNLYRAVFFDVNQFADTVSDWAHARKILDLGCGEGQVTQLLSQRYPCAVITGIDTSDRAGRIYRGERGRVEFQTQTIQQLALERPEHYDLIVICDVMHHVPWDTHVELLSCARQTLKPTGQLVLKEWEDRRNVINAMCYLADRYITGDKIRFGAADYWRELLHKVFGPNSIRQERRFSPWVNNMAFLVQG